MDSTINYDGFLDLDANTVLVRKGEMVMMLLNSRRAFLALAVVVAMEARSVVAVLFGHAGTLNSTAATTISGSRQTVRGLELTSEKDTITLSGWVMFPPMAIT